MSSCVRLTSPSPSPRGEGSWSPAPPDADDGIHIASVTRLETPGGSALRVVVSWMESGTWVERTVEIPEGSTALSPDACEPVPG